MPSLHGTKIIAKSLIDKGYGSKSVYLSLSSKKEKYTDFLPTLYLKWLEEQPMNATINGV